MPYISYIQASRGAFRDALRRFINDLPQTNTLLAGTELGDAVLDICIEMALSDFNNSAPVLQPYFIENFPMINVLMWGCVIQVLVSAGIMNARNELPYSAGGVSVNISAKSAPYQSWIQNLLVKYEKDKMDLKVFLNVQQAWGGIASEYSALGNAPYQIGDTTNDISFGGV